MIISHRLGAVFVKTRKTAGTSIEVGMSTLCGPQDLITPVSGDGEEDLRGRIGGRAPQHYRVPWSQLRRRHVAKLVRTRRRPLRVDAHSPATVALQLVGEHRWDDYLSFAVVRNPWDKLVSRYFWSLSANPDLPPFSAWMRTKGRHKFTCWCLYTDGAGKLIVDQVLRYESLAEDLGEVWAKLGVEPPELPRLKGGHRPEWSRDWRSMYSDEDAAYVAAMCAEEIAEFGYRFDP